MDWPRQGCAAITDWLWRGRLLPWVPPLGSSEILGEEGGFSAREREIRGGKVGVGRGKRKGGIGQVCGSGCVVWLLQPGAV